MKKLKIHFINHDWNANAGFFAWILSHYYKIEITPNDPDVVIVIDQIVPRYQNAKMILYTGEPHIKTGQDFDCYLNCFKIDQPNFFRIPLYTFYAYNLWKQGFIKSFNSVCVKENLKESISQKTEFCSYLARWGGGENMPREKIVKLVSKYKNVHCAGDHLNNYPRVPDGSLNKINFLKKYKFNIAVESYENFNGYNGYISEKIYEPMAVNCIPIYYGCAEVKKEFNNLSFLHARDYDDEQLLKKIIEIDKNDDLYYEYLIQPFASGDHFFDKDCIIDLFKKFI